MYLDVRTQRTDDLLGDTAGARRSYSFLPEDDLFEKDFRRIPAETFQRRVKTFLQEDVSPWERLDTLSFPVCSRPRLHRERGLAERYFAPTVYSDIYLLQSYIAN